MNPAFETIQIGPLKTAYHREAVDADFREALNTFLERTLLPQIDASYDRTEGTLTPEFNDEKHCGPNSAVRDAYRLKFALVRESGSEELEARIRRNRMDGSFEMRYKNEPIFLWTAKRKALQAEFRHAIQGIVQQILAGVQSDWICPLCGAKLSLLDAAHIFDLSCPTRCFTYNFHRDPQTKEFQHGHVFLKPPP